MFIYKFSFSEIHENEDESGNTPTNLKEKDNNFNNRFNQEEDVGGIGDMMTNLNINEKLTMNQNQNNFVIFKFKEMFGKKNLLLKLN